LFYDQIVNRKGRVEERMPLLVLFSADVMSCIFKAADAASSKSLDERHYNFLKKLTLVSAYLPDESGVLLKKNLLLFVQDIYVLCEIISSRLYCHHHYSIISTLLPQEQRLS
jgi:hypothetical protein